MIIPNGFKNNIADFFYDKTLTIYTATEQVDEEGWAGKTAVASAETFTGNVSFSNLAQIQEEYGLEEEISIAITTDEDVELDTILGYGDNLYRVMKAIPRDSHNFILAQEWSSKSTT